MNPEQVARTSEWQCRETNNHFHFHVHIPLILESINLTWLWGENPRRHFHSERPWLVNLKPKATYIQEPPQPSLFFILLRSYVKILWLTHDCQCKNMRLWQHEQTYNNALNTITTYKHDRLCQGHWFRWFSFAILSIIVLIQIRSELPWVQRLFTWAADLICIFQIHCAEREMCWRSSLGDAI